MASFDNTGVLAIEATTQVTVTLQNGQQAILPAFTPRSFAGVIQVVGTINIMDNATSESGNPIQVFRIDRVEVLA